MNFTQPSRCWRGSCGALPLFTKPKLITFFIKFWQRIFRSFIAEETCSVISRNWIIYICKRLINILALYKELCIRTSLNARSYSTKEVRAASGSFQWKHLRFSYILLGVLKKKSHNAATAKVFELRVYRLSSSKRVWTCPSCRATKLLSAQEKRPVVEWPRGSSLLCA